MLVAADRLQRFCPFAFQLVRAFVFPIPAALLDASEPETWLAPGWPSVPCRRRRWPFETGAHPAVSPDSLCLAPPAFDRPDVTKVFLSLVPTSPRPYPTHSLRP